MHEALARIGREASTLRADAEACDALGRLTALTADTLRSSGGIRLLQPKEFGGFEAHPNDFLEWVMAVAAESPSAGWVSGVVGLHPWEIALMDPRMAKEVWGDDPDTWVASPYAPFGRARRVDGGFLLSGRWPYSTGTDHCSWVVLGGMVADDSGTAATPPDIRHFMLPRGDYEIVENSWNVVGLSGSGSKDVEMTDVFVPDYRVVEAQKMHDGLYADERQAGKPLYRMLFALLFSAGISAATVGIAEGAVRSFDEYTAGRVSIGRGLPKCDPYQMAGFGETAADVAASRVHLLHITAELFDHVSQGGTVTMSQRLEYRRSQVRAARRAITAVERLANLAGAGSLALDQPLQRYWRDLHAGGNHICNVSDPVYFAWGVEHFGGAVPAGTFA